MVFFGQIHPETVQSKTCKGLFLANFARPPRQTFLSKELVKKKTCKGPFLANFAGKLGKPFCQRIFYIFFCQSISSLPFCQRLQPFCQRLPGSFFFKNLIANICAAHGLPEIFPQQPPDLDRNHTLHSCLVGGRSNSKLPHQQCIL